MASSNSTHAGPKSDEPDELLVFGPIAPLVATFILYLVTTVFIFVEYQNTILSNNNASVLQRQEDSTASRRNFRRAANKRDDSTGLGTSGMSGSQNNSPHVPGESSDGMKANGELNRRLFYKYLLQSQIFRLLLLPLSYIYPSTYQITSIVSQTLPTLSSVLSYVILILFYVQVAITAAGGGVTMGSGPAGSGVGGVTGNGNVHGNTTASTTSTGKGVFDLVQIDRTVSRTAFAGYALIVALNCVIPILTGEALEFLIWSILCFMYMALFFTMSYYGSKIMMMLNGNMGDGLGCRLVSMSTICCISFVLRAFVYGWDVYRGLSGCGRLFPDLPLWWNGSDDVEFGRNAVGYLTMEWLPAISVAALMHKGNKQHGADESAAALEAGQYSPLVLDQQGQILQQEPKKSSSIASGVKRSYSANGGVAIPHARTTPYMQHHQSHRVVASSSTSSAGGTMSRSTSGGRPTETTSLLGVKSHSAVASTSSYGIDEP